MTSASNVTPQHQTLLLKASTHTVLLSVLPTTPLTSVKRDLLLALASRGISELRSSATGTPIPVPAPEEVDRVQLGIAVDRKDLAGQGFYLLRQHGSTGFGEDEGKGKGKAKAGAAVGGSGKGKGKVTDDTVVGAGLKDGDVLAFRFTSADGEGNKTGNGMADGDMEMSDDEDDHGSWDVIWPKYEDEE